jgi:hypothetical protein
LEQARDEHGRFASGGTNTPPSSDSSSRVDMWYVTPVMEKKAIAWIESEDDSLESEHECPHSKKVSPYVILPYNVQIFSLIITSI